MPNLNPNVAIVDVQMPRMSGFEAARRLLDASPELRVILVSAHTDPQYEPLAQSVGAVGFLSKRAFSADEIVRLLDEN
jgi:two-component system response regulator DegU